MSGEVAEKYVEGFVGNCLMNTVHGSNLAIVEQGVFELHHKEACEICGKHGIHLSVCMKENITSNSYALSLLQRMWG